MLQKNASACVCLVVEEQRNVVVIASENGGRQDGCGGLTHP